MVKRRRPMSVCSCVQRRRRRSAQEEEEKGVRGGGGRKEGESEGEKKVGKRDKELCMCGQRQRQGHVYVRFSRVAAVLHTFSPRASASATFGGIRPKETCGATSAMNVSHAVHFLTLGKRTSTQGLHS
jgi:hypothetical protein